jgi:hypothetical protein
MGMIGVVATNSPSSFETPAYGRLFRMTAELVSRAFRMK